MNLRLAPLAFLLGSSLAIGAQEEAPRKTPPSAAQLKSKPARTPKVKPLELNVASKAELMKLPGITEDMAGKIIAGRPYLTKTNLVTRKILPRAIYTPIKHLITARQAPAAK